MSLSLEMSEDENSSAIDEYDEGDADTHASYQSMEDEFRHQSTQPFEFLDFEDSSSSDCESFDSKQLFSTGKIDQQIHVRKEAIINDRNKSQEKVIDIVPKAIRQSALAHLNNDAISRDLFKPCCSNNCLLKISPSHESCNFEPCLQFMRNRRMELFGKSLSEQITLLKTYIHTSMHRKLQINNTHASSSTSGRLNFAYVIEGDTFCGKGFCHVFGITYYLQKRLVKELKDGQIGVSYSDIDGKKLSTIDSEAAGNIVKLLNEHKIIISNSMRANLSLPDSDEIGYVSSLLILILLI